MELREYQAKLFNDICSAMNNGHSRVLAVAPCGAGKSYIFAKMVELASKGEVLVLTHRQELKRQHEELLIGLGLKNWRVSMVMTEAHRLGRYQKPSLIVADEAHLSRANSWVKVIEHYNTNTVGFTATPCRLTGDSLGDVYTSLVDSVSVKWLIKNGMLAPFEYYAPFEVSTDDVKTVAGDYIVKDLDKLMNDRAIYSNALESWKKLAFGEKTIAYCVSVEHAKKVAETFNLGGVKASYISGNTLPQEREKIMEDFRNGNITVLCNCSIISEGVSINDVSCCLLLRPTESIALGVQQMMRCMRYMPGKKAKIIDCVGNYTRIGLPDEDREWSLDKKVKKKTPLDNDGNLTVRVCPKCFLTFKTADRCPYCNAEYPLSPREIKAHEEIELQRITEEEMKRLTEVKKKQRMEVGRARTIEDLWQIARSRGYAPGWVYKMARAKGIRS